MSEDNHAAPPGAPGDIPGPTVDLKLATLGQRFLGALIDGVIMMAVISAYAALSDRSVSATPGEVVEMSDLLELSLIVMLVYLGLHGYLLHTCGQTIGKRLAGTRIVSATDGQIPPLGKIFGLRFVPIQLAGLIPGIGVFVAFIDVLFIFRGDRRCLHDFIAGTRVVQV
jgi:uncharacterized RDD family membrane protein YckC